MDGDLPKVWTSVAGASNITLCSYLTFVFFFFFGICLHAYASEYYDLS